MLQRGRQRGRVVGEGLEDAKSFRKIRRCLILYSSMKAAKPFVAGELVLQCLDERVGISLRLKSSGERTLRR